ncbi:MAG: hypothetical protein ACP5NQ_03430 [Vulcanisaeta sp.]
MHRWVYAIDASVRFFIRDISSFRLLIINAAIPIMVLSTYELLMNIFNTYAEALITVATPYSGSIINNVIHFINSITYLVVAALIVVFIVTSIFMVNGLVRSLGSDLRALANIFRSRVSITTYVTLIMILISIYSFVLGISISAVLVLVIMKVLTTLNIIPIINYGVSVTSALPALLPLIGVISVVYIIEGLTWVSRYAALP